jgi:predicted metal-dependent phosphoesterase TrpH
MRSRSAALLAELHAHSTWSDGAFGIEGLVDLYGTNGFDVLCVTDHVCLDGKGVTAEAYPAYFDEIRREAERARAVYDLLLLPGLELTFDHPDPLQAAHAVAIGLHQFVAVDDGIDRAIETAVQAGAALVAAHPNDDEPATHPGRLTQRFARDPELAARVHRFELFNRTQLFGWVARAGLPCVATGDFHRLEHLPGWKSVLPCARREDAVVSHLRSRRPVFLAEIVLPAEAAAA